MKRQLVHKGGTIADVCIMKKTFVFFIVLNVEEQSIARLPSCGPFWVHLTLTPLGLLRVNLSADLETLWVTSIHSHSEGQPHSKMVPSIMMNLHPFTIIPGRVYRMTEHECEKPADQPTTFDETFWTLVRLPLDPSVSPSLPLRPIIDKWRKENPKFQSLVGNPCPFSVKLCRGDLVGRRGPRSSG